MSARASDKWVVSVKHNDTADPSRIRNRPGSFTATAVPFRTIVMLAYDIRPFQIVGLKGWMESDVFDIEARADEKDGDPRAALQSMLKELLAERFRFDARFEKRPIDGYRLVVDKAGVKMRHVELLPPEIRFSAVPSDPELPPQHSVRNVQGGILASGIEIDDLTRTLTGVVQRPVIDATGLSGLYEVRLRWTPSVGEGSPFGPIATSEAASPSGAPSLFTAIQEQLGLRLEAVKDPIDVLVIRAADRLSDN
jgi:uncharacterized protein (TIGR03435 family)